MRTSLTVGICTGCWARINPGPYFTRRVVRHLNDGNHNHDAVEVVPRGSERDKQCQIFNHYWVPRPKAT